MRPCLQIFALCTGSRKLWNLNSALNHSQRCCQYFLKRGKYCHLLSGGRLESLQGLSKPHLVVASWALGRNLHSWREICYASCWKTCVFKVFKPPLYYVSKIFLTEYIVHGTHGKKSFPLEEKTSRRKRKDMLYTNKYQKEQSNFFFIQSCCIWYY